MKFLPFFCDSADPFSTVEWTTRNIHLKNAEGKTIYENVVEAPTFWSDQAVQIVASKYFYGGEKKENSVKQLIFRVTRTITDWGIQNGYFADKEEAECFYRELTWLCLHQYGVFNSPVLFNVGLHQVYGIKDEKTKNFYVYDFNKKKVMKATDTLERPQMAACFILSLDDTMDSIMALSTAEAMLYKYGSGIGTDYSTLRSSKEKISGGGCASGPLSFMCISDQIGAVIRSGGKTRRAASLKALNIDHPDIMEFIDAKMIEEKKAHALIREGYSGGMEGDAYKTVMYQNSNFSIRVTDEFMRTYENDMDWSTRAVTTKEVVETLKAKEIFSRVAKAASFCGDPGIQFHDTFNKWNTCKASGNLYVTNPCVTGDTKVYVFEDDKILLKRIDEINQKTVIVFAYDFMNQQVVQIKANNLGKTRANTKVIKIKTANGEIKLTPDHEVMTNRGWIKASEIRKGDKVYRYKK